MTASSWTQAPSHLDPPVEEIHVFCAALDLSLEAAAGLERVLAEDERARARRFHFARDRIRYVVGRARLREILGRYLRVDPASVALRYGRQGKPMLATGHDDDPGPRFNASGADGLALLAFHAKDEVGIDLERVHAVPDALLIAQSQFTADEHGALQALPPSEREAGFFRVWTRKEAVVKSTGLGFSQPIDSFTVPVAPDDGPEGVRLAVSGRPVHRWLLPVPPPAPGFLAALAFAGEPNPVRCWTWPVE